LERQHAHDAVVLHLHDEVAAMAIVRRHAFASRQLPRSRGEAKRLRRERAHRADVDHVPRQLRIDGTANEGLDFGMLAATRHAELHDAADLDAEAHVPRAMNAARHLLGRDERTHVLVEYDPLLFAIARPGRAIADGEVLQLALAALVADRAVERMVDEQEL